MKLSQLIDDLRAVGHVVGFDAPGRLDAGEILKCVGTGGECYIDTGFQPPDEDDECSECESKDVELAELQSDINDYEMHTKMLRKAIDRGAPIDDIDDICDLMESV